MLAKILVFVGKTAAYSYKTPEAPILSQAEHSNVIFQAMIMIVMDL